MQCVALIHLYIAKCIVITISFLGQEHFRFTLSNLQVYNTALLAVITTLYVQSPYLLHFSLEVCASDTRLPIDPTPSPWSPAFCSVSKSSVLVFILFFSQSPFLPPTRKHLECWWHASLFRWFHHIPAPWPPLTRRCRVFCPLGSGREALVEAGLRPHS